MSSGACWLNPVVAVSAPCVAAPGANAASPPVIPDFFRAIVLGWRKLQQWLDKLPAIAWVVAAQSSSALREARQDS